MSTSERAYDERGNVRPADGRWSSRGGQRRGKAKGKAVSTADTEALNPTPVEDGDEQ